MKIFTKISALFLLMTVTSVFLLSCANPDGRYTDEYGECSYIFDDKIVIVEYSDVSSSYFYEIEKRGEKNFLILYDRQTKEKAFDAVEYSCSDGYITLDGVKFIKQK